MNHCMEWLKPIWISLPKPQLEATAAAVQAADSTLGETSQHVFFCLWWFKANKIGGSTTMGIMGVSSNVMGASPWLCPISIMGLLYECVPK